MKREEKPNRLTREEFAKLPLGTKIVGINEDKNMADPAWHDSRQ